MRLAGARCLITGGSRGIGHALAVAFAQRGAFVYAGVRRLPEERDDGIERLELDVTDATSVRRALAKIGNVDVLVNNAGMLVSGAVEEIDQSDLLVQFETNFFAPWRLCRAVLPRMRAQGGGAIVNISSIGGELPYPGLGAYRASKHALRCLTWTLHFEVAHFGIRVLNVEPGAVDTDFARRSKRIGSGATETSPYAEMRSQADATYRRLAPARTAPATVAAAVVEELSRSDGPVDLVIGADAAAMLETAKRSLHAYEQAVVEHGFEWHPA
jgi:NAD(P)-dependent dehydrogenase (short-subunit alcohol dehydrogenase family)